MVWDPGLYLTIPGYQMVMPTFRGQLSEEQVLQLIAYIRSLGDDHRDRARARQAGATQPASQFVGTELPSKPDNQRANPAGSTPPRLVPIPPPKGDREP